MISSDDFAGLRAARKAIFGGVPWQRCQFHIQQNALAFVPRDAMKPEVTRDIKSYPECARYALSTRSAKAKCNEVQVDCTEACGVDGDRNT